MEKGHERVYNHTEAKNLKGTSNLHVGDAQFIESKPQATTPLQTLRSSIVHKKLGSK